MTPRTSHEHVQSKTIKTIGKKTGKTGTSTSMDDAPLFAGLDDFVPIQTGRKKTETPTVVQPKEKATIQQTPRATPKESLPQITPKPQGTQHHDSNSLLLSVAEMCALLKISRATLVRMDKSGKLPGRIKLGGSVRFHRETVETWLKSLITAPIT